MIMATPENFKRHEADFRKSLDSFTLGPGHSFTVSMPISILSGWLAADQPLGFTIPNLFLEDLTTGTIYDFKGDLVTSDGLRFWGYFPEFTATISYATVTTPEPGTPNATMPITSPFSSST